MKNISGEIKKGIINMKYCEKIVKKNKEVLALHIKTLWVVILLC